MKISVQVHDAETSVMLSCGTGKDSKFLAFDCHYRHLGRSQNKETGPSFV